MRHVRKYIGSLSLVLGIYSKYLIRVEFKVKLKIAAYPSAKNNTYTVFEVFIANNCKVTIRLYT